MLTPVRNGVVPLKDDTMYYVRFGSGKKTLVFLPGLGDGLVTVKGKAWFMALMYRAFTKDYTVYMFSRRNQLPAGSTTRDMACDLKEAMDALGVAKADLVGVSMGGMIAQHFAADYPQRTGRLVLVVTSGAPHDQIRESIGEWVAFARSGDHAAYMDSSARRMYSPAYYRKNRWLIPIMGKITKPKSYERFFIQAQACLDHDASASLAKITAPTLVIGGEQDQSLSPDASRRLAEAIPGAALKMYPDLGHGLYEEARDFIPVVLSFLQGH